jgi:hypothetical protein
MAVVELPGGSSIVFEAVDAATGLPVAGVVVTGQAVTAVDLSEDSLPDEPYPKPGPNGAYTQGSEAV